MRTCKKCGASKKLDEFVANRRLRDGRAYECKACCAERLRLWRTENPARAKAIRDRWNAAHPEQVKRINQDYYQANREKIEASASAWRKANPARWAEVIRLNRLRRESRKRGAANFDVSARDLSRLQRGPCSVDGCSATDIQLDHVIPLARGGSHGIGNLQPLCGHHNASKNDRMWIEFRRYLLRNARVAA